MTLIPERCVEYADVRQYCVAEQAGKTYRVINESGFKIRKLKVDGCVAQQNAEKRCDFLMTVDEGDNRRAIFIELKGGKIVQAVNQLYDSIEFLKTEFKHYRIDARIVGSKDAPQFINAQEYKRLNRLVKRFNGDIKRATNKFLSEII